MGRKVKIRNRRRWPRHLLGFRLEITRERSAAPGVKAGVFPGKCLDISRAGSRFTSRELFHPHEKLIVTYRAPDGGEALRCQVEVVRSVRVSRQYEDGVRFLRQLSRVSSGEPSFESSESEPSGISL